MNHEVACLRRSSRSTAAMREVLIKRSAYSRL